MNNLCLSSSADDAMRSKVSLEYGRVVSSGGRRCGEGGSC